MQRYRPEATNIAPGPQRPPLRDRFEIPDRHTFRYLSRDTAYIDRRFHVVVAEDGCFIGVAADKDWNLEFFGLGVDLCGLLWKYPSVNDGVKMNLPVLAPRLQNFRDGNTAEFSQCLRTVRNSQITGQSFSRVPAIKL